MTRPSTVPYPCQPSHDKSTEVSTCLALTLFFVMSFLGRLFGSPKPDKANLFKNITKGVDPLTQWKIIDQLGEGTFGIVHRVCGGTDGSVMFWSSTSNSLNHDFRNT